MPVGMGANIASSARTRSADGALQGQARPVHAGLIEDAPDTQGVMMPIGPASYADHAAYSRTPNAQSKRIEQLGARSRKRGLIRSTARCWTGMERASTGRIASHRARTKQAVDSGCFNVVNRGLRAFECSRTDVHAGGCGGKQQSHSARGGFTGRLSRGLADLGVSRRQRPLHSCYSLVAFRVIGRCWP